MTRLGIASPSLIASVRVGLILFLTLSLPRWVRADDSWVGTTILVKKNAIRIRHTEENDRPVYVATLTGIEYSVLADKGRFIQVQDEHGVAGWFDKKDAIRLEDAVDFFTDRIRAEPKNASTFCKRAIAWQLKGKFDNAVKDFDEVIRLDPKHPLAFINRGVVWVERQEYDKAIKDYDEAIRLDPRYVLAINNKAWLLATASDAKYRDGKRAVELATRACELSGWKVANYVDTLAAACAAAGQFAEAVKWQEKALEDTNFIKANGKKANEKLELFRDKKPYHKQ